LEKKSKVGSLKRFSLETAKLNISDSSSCILIASLWTELSRSAVVEMMHRALVQQPAVFLEDGRTRSSSDGSTSDLDQLQHGTCRPPGQVLVL
jgi:hypothetical protein